jgi:hypothetical protein
MCGTGTALGGIGSVLPPIPHSVPAEIEPPSRPLRDPPIRPSESLSHRISQNITLMHSMRETASLLTSMVNGTIEDHPLTENNQWKDHSLRIREFKRARTRSDGDVKVINESMAASQMRLATGVMLSHAGFEGCNSQALDFVAKIAEDFLIGLGKTAGVLLDRVTRNDRISAGVSVSSITVWVG